MAANIRRARKTFNIISVALIDELLKLFKEEPTLSFLKSEIQRFAQTPAESHVPAANFFQTMNTETKVPIAADSGRDDKIVVGELVIRKDERLFGPETGVKIPIIEALGLNEKWPSLSSGNKEMVWGYLIRMAKCAAEVVLGMQMMDPKMQEVVKNIQSTTSLKPGATEEEYAEFAKRVNEAMHKAMS